MNRLTLAAAIALAVILPAATQTEVLVLDHVNVFARKSRPAVSFPHDAHIAMDGISCTDCHHRYEKGVNVLQLEELSPSNSGILCASCHETAGALQRALHDKCIGCHEREARKAPPSGPRMCGECHVRGK